MIRKNIATNELGFVFNPATGDSFTTNPIAASIIEMLKQGKTLREINKILADTYDADPAFIEKDLYEFISTLKDNNLLVPGEI